MTKRQSSIEYRKDLSCKILSVAWNMFITRGLKAVRMDDIANELSISKRTLYEIFPNKEELICASFRWHLEEGVKELSSRITEESDAMDVLAEVFRQKLLQRKGVNPLIIEEIHSFPQVKELVEEIKVKHRENAQVFYKRGQDEGFFRSDANLKLLGELHHILGESLCGPEPVVNCSAEELFRTMMYLFIRSICTEKGIKRFDSMMGMHAVEGF